MAPRWVCDRLSCEAAKLTQRSQGAQKSILLPSFCCQICLHQCPIRGHQRLRKMASRWVWGRLSCEAAKLTQRSQGAQKAFCCLHSSAKSAFISALFVDIGG